MTLDQNRVKTELGIITGNRAYDWPTDTPVEILLRPDDIAINGANSISAEVSKRVFSGSSTLYNLRLPSGSIVEALFPSHQNYALGDTLQIKADVEHLIAFTLDE